MFTALLPYQVVLLRFIEGDLKHVSYVNRIFVSVWLLSHRGSRSARTQREAGAEEMRECSAQTRLPLSYSEQILLDTQQLSVLFSFVAQFYQSSNARLEVRRKVHETKLQM